jgi:general L-amino acid transport system substrate-binding protein
MKYLCKSLLQGCVMLLLSLYAHAGTLDAVRDRGVLRCGVSEGIPGFSERTSRGIWQGMDVDMCRALAAAVLGDARQVHFVPLTAGQRFQALRQDRVDVLMRNTSWNLTRDAGEGLSFVGISYHDGQGFMVRKSLGISRARQLNGVSVCVQSGTTSEHNLHEFAQIQSLDLRMVLSRDASSQVKAFEDERCDVMSADHSRLKAVRLQLRDPRSVLVLQDLVSKEPLGPVVRDGDDQWFDVVRWVLFLLINAEERALSSQNVSLYRRVSNPAIQRILGSGQDHLGQALGLGRGWALDAIGQVGNYGEIFERNVGMDSPLKIGRGINALWTRGGLLYAPPMQ